MYYICKRDKQVMLGVTVITIGVLNCKSMSTSKLNYLVLAFSLGIAILDCLKMPFAADSKYNDSSHPIAG
jgi:hypothetical protein